MTRDQTTYTRRRVLALSAGTLAATVGSGCLGVGEQLTMIELRAAESGWVGERPASIRGTTNPTLALSPGDGYELVWYNDDGRKHEFAVLDEAGSAVYASDSAEEHGAQRTLAFQAEPKLVTYHDHYHPEAMHGPVAVGSSSSSDALQGE
jgi:hypothetical protein